MKHGTRNSAISPSRLLMALAALAILLLPGLTGTARAQNVPTETVLYSFHGGTDGSDAIDPLTLDAAGNLYGTTYMGGVPKCFENVGCGTVFKLDPSGKETVLYGFKGHKDGSYPVGGVVRDGVGNLFGVASDGMGSFGSVYRLAPSGQLTTLYTFINDGTGGSLPAAGVIRDAGGNIFGTTYLGGAFGKGVVYKIDATQQETVLYAFKGGTDGSQPAAPLFRDSAGNLYGTTNYGGDLSCNLLDGCGTIFKIDNSGNETVLYRFTNGSDGGYPCAGVIQDSSGNLYGTASEGGDTSCNPPYGCGTAFKLDSSGNFTVLHTFTGSPDGAIPAAGLVLGPAGSLYGTTSTGGRAVCAGVASLGCGTAFKIDALGNETLLHIFAEGDGDGLVPFSALIRDPSGNFYGTTSLGGTNGRGTIYKISAP